MEQLSKYLTQAIFQYLNLQETLLCIKVNRRWSCIIHNALPIEKDTLRLYKALNIRNGMSFTYNSFYQVENLFASEHIIEAFVLVFIDLIERERQIALHVGLYSGLLFYIILAAIKKLTEYRKDYVEGNMSLYIDENFHFNEFPFSNFLVDKISVKGNFQSINLSLDIFNKHQIKANQYEIETHVQARPGTFEQTGQGTFEQFVKLRVPHITKLLIYSNLLEYKILHLLNLDLVDLKELNLINNSLSPYLFDKVFMYAYMPNLISLSLSNNFLGNEGLKVFAKKKHIIENLHTLDIACTLLGDQWAKDLAFFDFSNLEALDVHDNLIDNDGMKSFSKINFPYLKKLNLAKNRIADRGMLYFSKMKLPSLVELNLENNLIKESGMAYVSNMYMPCIERIMFYYNPVHKEDFLYSNLHFPKLVYVHGSYP